MQVFEFHFNPKVKEDLIFDSFCYEPENIYEKRVGSLYLAGSLKNALPPQNSRFLDNLAKVIKEKYYSPTIWTPEKSLKESLKRANEFLENLAKSGDVSWLGNLSLTALSLKNLELNFTKVGNFKILLLRRGRIIDIDKKLKFQEIEPYPLKIFGNIISGKLAEDDMILALTKDIFELFQGPAAKTSSTAGQSQNLLNEIASLYPFDSKELKRILNKKRGELLKLSGICLLISLSKGVEGKEKRIISLKLSPKAFSLKEIFSPLINTFKRIIQKPRPERRKIKFLEQARPSRLLTKARFFKFPFKIPWPKASRFKIPKIRIPEVGIRSFNLSKNLILILALILLSALGFFIFEKEEEGKLKEYQAVINQIQEKVTQAESFLILAELNPQAEEKANLLLQESWEEISPLVKIVSTLPSDFSNQIFSLKAEVSKSLYQLNEFKIVEEPELFFEFNPRGFIPQRIIVSDGNLYFFSSYSQNLFRVSGKSQGELIQIDLKLNSAVVLDGSILFFSKPDKLISFKEGQFGQAFSLESPYSDFNFNDFSSYKSSLYFLDKEAEEIIKYPYLGNLKWGSPQIWLSSQNKKAIESRSMAVDGSIWILSKNNSINRYYAGQYQKTIKLDFFPYPENLSKIFTSSALPYLYLLEPVQNRVVILSKSGQIIKQYQSEKFDNLLDFAVSRDGKMIYLLNGLKVYQIEL